MRLAKGDFEEDEGIDGVVVSTPRVENNNVIISMH